MIVPRRGGAFGWVACALAVLGTQGAVRPACAQFFFGKNKVQYRTFDWHIQRTEHFDIYFYPEEAELASIGAAYAEAAYRDLERKFSYTARERIPVIFYSSPLHFQGTNTILAFLPESVGGFTEFARGRVVVPFNGSLSRFERIIRHELVHAFMHQKLRAVLRRHRIRRGARAPLWFSEGLAEHWSGSQNAQGEMILRDAVLTGHLDGLDYLARVAGTFQMYKAGESLVGWMGRTLGDEVLLAILEDWWKADDFSTVVAAATGRPLGELAEAWCYGLKKRVLPLLADHDEASHAARRLTAVGLATGPEVVPSSVMGDSDQFLFFSNYRGFPGIYVGEVGDKDQVGHVLLEGARSGSMESLHLLQTGLSISSDGRLAFVAKSGPRDVLTLFDLGSRRVTARLGFPSLVTLRSPSWSPDGGRLVFSGEGLDGFTDLYVVTVENGALERLTEDLYSDRNPAWSPDGKRIAFDSDRLSSGTTRHVFVLDVATGSAEPLVGGAANFVTPVWSPDGSRLAVASDRDGTFNLYLLALDGRLARVTRVLTAARDPAWLEGGDGLLFTGYEEGRMEVYAARIDSLEWEAPLPPLAADSGWAPPSLAGPSAATVFAYVPRFDLDIAQTQIAQDAQFGAVGGLNIAISDMLGDDRYYFTLASGSSRSATGRGGMNIGVTHVSLGRRTDMAFGIFHLHGEFDAPVEGLFKERRFGGFVMASRPLSRFQRLEFRGTFRQSDRRWKDGSGRIRRALLHTTGAAFVRDTSLWGATGPIDGDGLRASVAHTIALESAKVHYLSLELDVRRYFRFTRRAAVATRGLLRTSLGREPERFAMGGSWTLRGYPWRSIEGRYLGLWTNELRFPLVDTLALRLPFGGLRIDSIRGALFVDAGNAWERDRPEVLGSFGGGFRIRLGPFLVLRYDIAKRVTSDGVSERTFTDLFFGWDF